MMSFKYWTSFGASIIGYTHIISGRANQDSWASFHHANCDVLVVADGLGSKKYSKFASMLACKSVDRAAQFSLISKKGFDLDNDRIRNEFLEEIKGNWIKGILPLNSDEASTTCLFTIRTDQNIVWIGALGDGCVAALLEDGTCRFIARGEEKCFSNITNSLKESTRTEDWKIMAVDGKQCRAFVLFTDGIADDIEDIQGFVNAFVDSCCGLPIVCATSTAFEMLKNWPTPKSSDDKTIACLFERDYPNEN